MEFSQHDEPPTKKRRVFDRSDDDGVGVEVKHESSGSRSPSPLPNGRFFDDPSPTVPSDTKCPIGGTPANIPIIGQRGVLEDVVNRSTPRPPRTDVPAQPRPQLAEQTGFDHEMLETIVGAKVDPEILDILQEQCGGNMERAVNMYFDGTWKRFGIKREQREQPVLLPRTLAAKKPAAVGTDQAASARPNTPVPIRDLPEARYIGAFGVEGWATRSGTNLLKHGDVVRIERQKIQLPRPPAKGGKTNARGAPVGGLRISMTASKRVDVIVRFCDQKGSEIGRLAKDTANWVSTLMDQRVAKFEGVCVYAPERLRTNGTVILQLRCSILPEAFAKKPPLPDNNRQTGLFEEQESEEERELRLRQVALVRVFQEVNLLPTRSSASTASQSRQGLLAAAEMAEQKHKESIAGGGSRAAGTTTSGDDPASSDAEDGKELEQDQLDALYKKAQSFDFDTPEAEPADTFAMELRPYQKQSLHWMLAKERDERSKERESSMHPLWEEYEWPTRDFDDKPVPQPPDQRHFYVNPYSGEMSLEFPVQEQHCLGGILADEMGLGKTIQMLSLIHTHKSEAALAAAAVRSEGGGLDDGGAEGRSDVLSPATTTLDELRRVSLLAGSAGVVPAPFTTLVVAPMSLLSQWQGEAVNASKEGTLRSMVYYGADKAANLAALCSSPARAPDVIITSYGIVLSEFGQVTSRGAGRESHRGLFSVRFFRLILDEAHSIKNRQSKTAKACYELAADHRWALTGTPIVNRLEDLFSLVRFLRVEPWNNFSFWRTFITVPFESKDFMRALDVVQTVLEPLVMRRTKDMRTPAGRLLVDLPPKTVEIVEVELSKTERAVYDHIFLRARDTFQANVEAGTVLKAYTSIFVQILRLRQSCCHPTLVRNRDIVADEELAGAAADAAAGLADDMDLASLLERFTASTDDPADANAFGAHVLGQIRDEAVNECPICTEEPMVEQTVTGCWHSTCRKCILDYIRHEKERDRVPRCVHCREPINERDLFEVVRHDDELATDDDDDDNDNGDVRPGDVFRAPARHQQQQQRQPRISLQRLGVNYSSTKVVALISALRALRREQPRTKSVVFSQFTSFMTLIEPALARANMRFLRLDGSMAQKARAAVLDEFRAAPRFTVLLLSLRAGGVGLNLTQARRVFLMDPWWSFAVEAQAIDRVHRMGQDGEVKVYRFIVKDSVEERMLRVQDRKKFIATSLGMMTDAEKKLARIEDIKELLS